MENIRLALTEQLRPSVQVQFEMSIKKIITTWLTKELHK